MPLTQFQFLFLREEADTLSKTISARPASREKRILFFCFSPYIIFMDPNA